MRSHLSQYLLLFLVVGCAQVTLRSDVPEHLDGFLRLPWGLALDTAQAQMLLRPQVTLDRTLTNSARGVLVFRNVTFLDIPVDRCTLIFFELGGLSDVQLRFLRPDTEAAGLFDSLRTSIQRIYGPGVTGDNRIEWAVQQLRTRALRERRVILTLEPTGSIVLHAHADYAETQH